ncbi:hypothetical protein NP233_g6882 [Leucocoprinus birnbaumii]|uniref:Uncharacterized protein n=1 Tax=Leucocoprinus birnbaumii TaxID=56174 RepID=A0AAD5VRD0_9AGAR|nr:hypothetical protein NP233_g6882 [Leucocoprinus birnbaumii]
MSANFKGANNFSINNSTFNSIRGSQNNYTFQGDYDLNAVAQATGAFPPNGNPLPPQQHQHQNGPTLDDANALGLEDDQERGCRRPNGHQRRHNTSGTMGAADPPAQQPLYTAQGGPRRSTMAKQAIPRLNDTHGPSLSGEPSGNFVPPGPPPHVQTMPDGMMQLATTGDASPTYPSASPLSLQESPGSTPPTPARIPLHPELEQKLGEISAGEVPIRLNQLTAPPPPPPPPPPSEASRLPGSPAISAVNNAVGHPSTPDSQRQSASSFIPPPPPPPLPPHRERNNTLPIPPSSSYTSHSNSITGGPPPHSKPARNTTLPTPPSSSRSADFNRLVDVDSPPALPPRPPELINNVRSLSPILDDADFNGKPTSVPPPPPPPLPALLPPPSPSPSATAQLSPQSAYSHRADSPNLNTRDFGPGTPFFVGARPPEGQWLDGGMSDAPAPMMLDSIHEGVVHDFQPSHHQHPHGPNRREEFRANTAPPNIASSPYPYSRPHPHPHNNDPYAQQIESESSLRAASFGILWGSDTASPPVAPPTPHSTYAHSNMSAYHVVASAPIVPDNWVPQYASSNGHEVPYPTPGGSGGGGFVMPESSGGYRQNYN